MLCSQLTVSPTKKHPNFWEYGAAFASVFVNSDDVGFAKDLTKKYMADHHWKVESWDECVPVHIPEGFDDVEMIALCNKALKDGVSVMFVACPPGGEI